MTWHPVVLMSIPALKIQIMTHESKGINFLYCRRYYSLIYMHWIGWSEQWTLWRLHRVLILTWRQMCDHRCGSNPYSISKLFQHSTKNFISFQFKVDWFTKTAITFLFLKKNCSLPSISSFVLLVVNLSLFNNCVTTAKSPLTGQTHY